jgi:hypothetical protein
MDVSTPLHPRVHRHVACKSVWNYATLLATHSCRCGKIMKQTTIAPLGDS